MADLKTLAATAEKEGWATGSGDVGSMRAQATQLGWVEVAPRRGDATVSVLRPTLPGLAHPSSLSAVYGLGQQPLHTDGAHLQVPPDLLVFISEHPNATPTQMLRADVLGPWGARPRMPMAALAYGMFLVRSGRDSFYVPALAGFRFRYDPGCMTPCDARALEVKEYFSQLLSHAAVNEWSAAGQVLVVDNRHVLHARPAVAEGDLERKLTRIAFRTGAAW